MVAVARVIVMVVEWRVCCVQRRRRRHAAAVETARSPAAAADGGQQRARAPAAPRARSDRLVRSRRL